MSDLKAELRLPDQTIELPVIIGSEGEKAIDIRKLRGNTGWITLDSGFGNTGSCQSAITFINGEEGVLRLRGYPIVDVAQNMDFIEAAMMLIWGRLPTQAERDEFGGLLTDNAMIHEDLRHHFNGFPPTAHPMAILSAVVNAMGCYHADFCEDTEEECFTQVTGKIMAKVRTIAAYSYKKSLGQPIIYPRKDLGYVANFLHMMFSEPNDPYDPPEEVVRAMELFFVLHADHEQNCSTSTVRMVGSSGANLFASVAAGILALWGPLHGGANQAVIEMLTQIDASSGELEEKVDRVLDRVKRKEFRLMGFGHRVYKSFDPRALILKKAADDLLATTGGNDPLLDIAKYLEKRATEDEYFVERGLYPNVDFYSGIILRTIGIPLKMFPVLFAIGRMPGWIAQWRELYQEGGRIHRPRQIYIGANERQLTPMAERVVDPNISMTPNCRG